MRDSWLGTHRSDLVQHKEAEVGVPVRPHIVREGRVRDLWVGRVIGRVLHHRVHHAVGFGELHRLRCHRLQVRAPLNALHEDQPVGVGREDGVACTQTVEIRIWSWNRSMHVLAGPPSFLPSYLPGWRPGPSRCWPRCPRWPTRAAAPRGRRPPPRCQQTFWPA